MRQRLEIQIDEAGRGTVRFNGRPIKTRRIEILAGVGMATSVVLEIVDVEVTAVVEGVVPLVDETTSESASRHYRLLE